MDREQKVYNVRPVFESSDRRSPMVTWSHWPGALGYNVYRSIERDTGFVQLNLSPVTVLFYRDVTAAQRMTYWYRVTVITADGESPLAVSDGVWFKQSRRKGVMAGFRALETARDMAFRLGGAERVTWYLHPMAGVRCSICWDEDIGQQKLFTVWDVLGDSDQFCRTCWGTTWDGGFVNAGTVLCKLSQQKKDIVLTKAGFQWQYIKNGEVPAYPIVYPGDIYVRENGERYLVIGGVHEIKIQGSILRQRFNSGFLPWNHPLYELGAA